MKIRIFRQVADSVYTVKIQTEDWSQVELNLMRRFGQPEIEVGGVITVTPASELPTQKKLIQSQSPFVASFDDMFNALAWEDKLVERIEEAVTELRELEDTFTGERLVEV